MKRKIAILVLLSVLIALGLFSCGRTQQDTVNGFITAVNSGSDPSMYFYTSSPYYTSVNVSWMEANFPPVDRDFSADFLSSGVDSETVRITGGAGYSDYYFEFVREGADANINDIYLGTNNSGTSLLH